MTDFLASGFPFSDLKETLNHVSFQMRKKVKPKVKNTDEFKSHFNPIKSARQLLCTIMIYFNIMKMICVINH